MELLVQCEAGRYAVTQIAGIARVGKNPLQVNGLIARGASFSMRDVSAVWLTSLNHEHPDIVTFAYQGQGAGAVGMGRSGKIVGIDMSDIREWYNVEDFRMALYDELTPQAMLELLDQAKDIS